MKYHNELVDDDGQRWEFSYEQSTTYARDDDGKPQYAGTVVREFRYRKDGEIEWLTLPSWADVAEEWKINLCLFDEDEETGELTFWPIGGDEAVDFVIGLPGGGD